MQISFFFLISGPEMASMQKKSQYEIDRDANVAKNKAFLKSLNICHTNGQQGTSKPPRKKAKVKYHDAVFPLFPLIYSALSFRILRKI